MYNRVTYIHRWDTFSFTMESKFLSSWYPNMSITPLPHTYTSTHTWSPLPLFHLCNHTQQATSSDMLRSSNATHTSHNTHICELRFPASGNLHIHTYSVSTHAYAHIITAPYIIATHIYFMLHAHTFFDSDFSLPPTLHSIWAFCFSFSVTILAISFLRSASRLRHSCKNNNNYSP